MSIFRFGPSCGHFIVGLHALKPDPAASLKPILFSKSGKSRSVPVSKELFEEIRKHLTEHVGFSFSLSAFRRALDKSGILLPPGQAAHVLRHTFASHFVMNGGDILSLQKILGHSTISMTMRYAHLCPRFLEEAVMHNPMSSLFRELG